MGYFHDDDDDLDQLIRDAKDPDNPQGGIPDSVRESAIQELRNRGISERDISEIRTSYESDSCNWVKEKYGDS